MGNETDDWEGVDTPDGIGSVGVELAAAAIGLHPDTIPATTPAAIAAQRHRLVMSA
jgi:hypothetical protein